MATRFERRESYQGFEYRFTVCEDAATSGHEIWVVVSFDLGDVVEERKYTLKQKHFASLEDGIDSVIAFAKKAIDDFKTK